MSEGFQKQKGRNKVRISRNQFSKATDYSKDRFIFSAIKSIWRMESRGVI